MDLGTVEAMVAFQRQGTGFGAVWQDIRPVVEKTVRRELRNRLVRGHKTAEDEAAIDDTLQQVVSKLLQLPSKPNSWFDPKKGKGTGGVSALKGWLSRIAANETVEYCRAWRGAGRSVKSIPLSQLELNGPVESRWAAKPDLAKLRIDEAELPGVLNECIDSLEDEPLRRMVKLRLQENLSERKLAERLGMNVTTVHRRLHEAYDLLRPLLEQRGIDADWRPGMGL
jgi:RNA polymerase sigma factor (sigma-70 family)